MTRLVDLSVGEAIKLTGSAAWKVVIPAGAIEVNLQRRDRLGEEAIRRMPAGTEVVLVDSGPASRWRCRRYAARAGLQIRRSYLAFPSVDQAFYVVEDDWCSVAWFWARYLTVPPGQSRLQAPLTLALWAVRPQFLQRLLSSAVAQRVVLGKRC
jgi:hypothetical protein